MTPLGASRATVIVSQEEAPRIAVRAQLLLAAVWELVAGVAGSQGEPASDGQPWSPRSRPPTMSTWGRFSPRRSSRLRTAGRRTTGCRSDRG